MAVQTTHEEGHDYLSSVSLNRLGLWIFLFSELFLFGGILVSRVILWGNTRPELEQFPALVLTSALLLSSFFMNRAEIAVRYGDRKNFLNSVLITILLGTLFLIGVVAYEWPESHLSPSESVYGAVFYLMTGMHAFHVFTGIIFLAVIYFNGKRGLYTPQRYWAVQAGAVYWHFVDVVWVFFYPAIYLMGLTIG